jgi:nucleoside-diphosphate-sugar epimerase
MGVFVTGAAGFIGSAVVKELIKEGHQMVWLAARMASGAAVSPHRSRTRELFQIPNCLRSLDLGYLRRPSRRRAETNEATLILNRQDHAAR